MRAAIYYPFVEPPTHWIKQSLLYWDTVCSIVPDDFDPSPDLAWLIDQNAFEGVQAHQLSWNSQEQVREEILSYLVWADANGVELHPPDVPTEGLIGGKLLRPVEKDIEDFGLLRPAYGGMSFISGTLLELLISVVAKHLAMDLSREHRYYTIHTTDSKLVQLGLDPLSGGPVTPGYNLLLRDLLPYPDESVPFERILDFRASHHQELLRLRRAIERLHAEILSEVPLQAALASLHDEIEAALHDTRKALRNFKISTVAGTVSVLLLTDAAAMNAQDGLGKLQAPWVFSNLGTTVLASLVATWARVKQRRGDFSYLHRAQGQFSHPSRPSLLARVDEEN